jgi:hypothetical protein
MKQAARTYFLVSCMAYSSSLKMEEICSSGMLWRQPSKERTLPLTLKYIDYFKSSFIKTFQPLY